MQNPPLKFRQSCITSKKPGYFSATFWRAPITMEFNIFCWNFAHLSYLPVSTKQVFACWWDEGSPPPPNSRIFSHFPHLQTFPQVDSPHQIFIAPQKSIPSPPLLTKQQFSSYNPIKTAFLTLVIALASFLL